MVKRAMASTCALPSIMRDTDDWELRRYGIAHSGPTRDAPDASLPETVCRKDE